ncbi:hypothetical protein [Acidovorax sacchari]|uniref:hypothetical protein n=1 Tax=Acidovorax sacchari TaxID=3230736 RepID=UPI0039E2932A
MINWAVELLDFDRLHKEEELASNGVIKALPFEAHAMPVDIDAAERAIAGRFDCQHVDFLLHANGWNNFSADIDLFGTPDFCGSNRFRQAQEWVNMMHRGALGSYAKQRSSMLPIAKSSSSTDLLLMIRERGQVQPKVLWVTNELVEEFEDFNQMFVSFKKYQQQAIDYWLKRNKGGTP